MELKRLLSTSSDEFTALTRNDPAAYGQLTQLLAQLDGTAYVARGSVHDAKGVARLRRFLDRAFSSQMKGQGFSFVEILTMCPTGWFLPTAQGPEYLDLQLGAVHEPGEIKKDGVLIERAKR